MTTVKTRDTATQSIYKLLNATLVYKKAHTDISAAEGLTAWLETNRPEYVKVNKGTGLGKCQEKHHPDRRRRICHEGYRRNC